MAKQEIYSILLIVAIAAQLQAATLLQTQANTDKVTLNDGTSQPATQSRQLDTPARTGRIMKILKDPAPLVKRNREPPPPYVQSRRERFPPNQQRLPIQITYHRQPYGGGPRNQILRRVQNGPPPQLQPTTALRPQQAFAYEPLKSARYAPGHKDNIPPPNFGKAAVYRAKFPNVPHPNAIALQGHSQQYAHNFKASPQYNGNAIVRPVPDLPTVPHAEIKQYPLPQQHPQHQHPTATQHSHINTAPQTFPTQQQPVKQYTEALLKPADNTAPQAYSVYEDPEISEHASLQMNSQQNPLAFNPNVPLHIQQQQQQQQHHHQQPVAKEAEDYLKFMSTNEYFLPKFNPNYKKLDEEQDLRQYRLLRKQQHQHQQQQQQQQQSPQYTKHVDGGGPITFKEPIEVSQLFYHGDPDPSPSSTIVRGSYQAGSNVFVVNSDGNKAIKHIVPSSLAPQDSTTPSPLAGIYNHARFNFINHHTPEPIRFEFTERDAVLAGHTNSPPLHGNRHYQSVSPTPSGIEHNRPISVNEVDADPEDGDDMQEAGTDFYGRVPISRPTENSVDSKKVATSTPAAEQKDTEEYCESICANVQDENAEIICGSDGYMYTGEAQMECYASCLHIEVTIQGKGSCSAR